METDTAQLKRSCNKFKRILRPLLQENSRSKNYNPQISDTEFNRLKIDVHQLDIETGATSPPIKSFFLPRTDFHKISDACKRNLSLNWVWMGALNRKRTQKLEGSPQCAYITGFQFLSTSHLTCILLTGRKAFGNNFDGFIPRKASTAGFVTSKFLSSYPLPASNVFHVTLLC
jgi:hypothetical protein